MITHVSHIYSDLQSLISALNDAPLIDVASKAQSILVQVYCAKTDPEYIRAITSCIIQELPQAIVVGATTVGEIAYGRLLTEQTVIGFTFFATSSVKVIALPCHSGHEKEVGAELAHQIVKSEGKVAGVLLLATPLSIDAAELLHGIASVTDRHLIFGGGAGDYAAMMNSMVFSGTSI